MNITKIILQNKNKMNEVLNTFNNLNEYISTHPLDTLGNNNNLLKKLHILHDNMDIINDNIMDLYTDLHTDTCILPSDIKEHIDHKNNIEHLCKDLSPLILLYIINKNYTKQEYV